LLRRDIWRVFTMDESCTLLGVVALNVVAVTEVSGGQSQSHIATDGQSVSMSWCRAQSGTFDQRFFFSMLLSCLLGAPSLTRGRVCHVSVFVIVVYSCPSIFTTNIYIKFKIYMCYKHLQYIQASCSPGFVQQIMPYLLIT
jgi:hypothetical protein